ncbi:hypothetical protein NESM_000692100 [Novymonas esmeraldas]|uniref:Uncharacterized protein n=1 Tax=Novymonas esmeraldas TaxID=1808958 RepID=A0AAW0EWH6_9TRYP
MPRPSWPAHTASLDNVVRSAVSTPAAGSSSSSPATAAPSASVLLSASSTLDTVSAAAIVSRLAAHDASLASLALTPTVQAMQVLCRSFVEAYETPEALARDTARWCGEAARLHTAHTAGVPPPRTAADVSASTRPGWGELLRHVKEVVESTHHITATRRTEDAVVPALSLSPMRGADASGDVNVLRLGGGDAQNAAWESLELLDGSAHGSGVAVGMQREEHCLRLIDDMMECAVPHDGPLESEARVRDVEQLEGVRYLLQRRPELVAQHERLAELQRAVVDRACVHRESGWSEAALALFHAMPPRAQLDLVHTVVSAVAGLGRARAAPTQQLATLVHRLLVELPHGWLPLLDSEVTDLFVRVLSDVAVPLGPLLSEVDPHAVWLVHWYARPSVALSVDTLLHTHRRVLDDLAAQLPSPHATCTLLFLLPQLCERGEGESHDAAARQSWQQLFCVLHGYLCADVWPSAGVYEIGAHALCRCAAALRPAEAERCLDGTAAVILRWSAAAPASHALDAQFIFALRLVTALLTAGAGDDAAAALWGPRVWEVVDGALYAQSRALLRARRDRQPSSPMLFRGSSVAVADVVRECWAQLLLLHASRLPRTLAAAVKEAWGGDVTAAVGTGVFGWCTLVRVSTTLAGWAALQPYVHAVSRDASHASARWAGLLHAIVEVSGGALDQVAEEWAAHAASARRPRRRSSRALGRYPLSITPAGAALLLRWSTCAVARDGLAQAARDASLALLRGSPHASARRTRWPLLWPVEGCPHTGPSDLSVGEDTFGVACAARAGACYQSIHVLLTSLALPGSSSSSSSSACGSSTGGESAAAYEMLEEAWAQVAALWLDPAQLTAGTASTTTAASDAPTNRPPFGDDSLLMLVSIMAVCVLVQPAAEYRAWFDPAAAPSRIRELRRLCEERRGVDPVYFMVRFVTSGKGRKRLPAILLDGFAAELTVDAVCDVASFSEGEDHPAGDLAATASAAAAAEEEEERRLRATLRRLPSSPSAPTSSSPRPDTASAAAVARCLLVNRAALRVAWTDIEVCLSRRSAGEWASFANAEARTLAVCAALEQQHAACTALLASAHVDMVFLVSLCLRGWLCLPMTHCTPARRKLYWTAVQWFSEHGVAAFDALVARSLAAHVERAVRESAVFVKEAIVFPVSRSLPLPSALFALILVRPFALAV